MNTRTITVINTSTQDDKTIEFDANHPCETLGQLKEKLDEIGMPYTDMKFVEANSKSTYEDDDAQLPKEVNFIAEDGTTQLTNDLVFVLTKKNKKTASGINRADVLAAIKALGLQDCIRTKENKSYTNVSTDILESYINEAKEAKEATSSTTSSTTSTTSTSAAVAEAVCVKATNVSSSTPTSSTPTFISTQVKYSPVGEAILTIAAALGNNNILSTEETVKIIDLMQTEKRGVESPYSQRDKQRLIQRVLKSEAYTNDVDEEEEY